jgi:hypothetical protein
MDGKNLFVYMLTSKKRNIIYRRNIGLKKTNSENDIHPKLGKINAQN